MRDQIMLTVSTLTTTLFKFLKTQQHDSEHGFSLQDLHLFQFRCFSSTMTSWAVEVNNSVLSFIVFLNKRLFIQILRDTNQHYKSGSTT